ncbi:MAG TPA: ribbon-helix-helix protein, CopG family [Thermoanaerobaculia bacterium]|nr:ribbon-helix-helix protein, CopG family [Thermoanaerobaculia bacterium]
MTITLDDDVAETLEEETRRTGASVDEAVNAAVRRLRPAKARFQVETFSLGPPRISIDCTAEALEFEDAAEQE